MNEYKYAVGLEMFEVLLEPDDSEALDSFDTYKDALLRHLEEYRRFGGSDAAINRDVANLNRLARQLSGYSFNNLCVSRHAVEMTLAALLAKLPRDKAHQVAARIVHNRGRISERRISEDQAFLQGLAVKYQVPSTGNLETVRKEVGPSIDWRGPDDLELQSFFRPEPDLLDMGLLKRAVERSSAICLLSIPPLNRTGTGFLIAPGCVLTNYHVLRASEPEDLEENARALKLSFGYLTSEQGTVPTTFTLTERQPILSLSPAHELDYVLLQLADKTSALQIVPSLPFALEPPTDRSGLYILQHPQGGPMKLAINSNGVTGVYPDTGRVQYVTRAAPGSSGSPCFNQDWNLVALHHAERAKGVGTIREGILFGRIYDRISDYLVHT